MKIYGDYHSHTYFSDGKGSIEQSIIHALSLGLCELAITDHAFKHLTNGISHKGFQTELRQLEEMRIKYPQIKIYNSLEFNLMGESGKLDVEEKDIQHLDFLLFGFHKTAQSEKFSDFWKFKICNNLPIFKPSKMIKERATKAYLNCLERYPISFVNHLNYALNIDIKPIAKLCKEKDIYIELNGKRVFFDQQEVDIMLEEGVTFIINSDAHRPEKIGDFSLPIEFAKSHNIPFDRIVNLNQKANLKLLR